MERRTREDLEELLEERLALLRASRGEEELPRSCLTATRFKDVPPGTRITGAGNDDLAAPAGRRPPASTAIAVPIPIHGTTLPERR